MDGDSNCVSSVPPGWGTPMGTPTRRFRNTNVAPQTTSSYVPNAIERHLQAVDYNKEGHLLLGCSNLSGRQWIGSLWYFSDAKAAPAIDKAVTGVDCDYGVVEAIFDGKCDTTVYVGMDNGSVDRMVMAYSEEETESASFEYLERASSLSEHDDLLTGMALTCDNRLLLTVGYDCAVAAVATDAFALERRWNKAHGNLISGVDANRVAPNLFATVANDGLALAWDVRDQERQSVLLDSSEGTTPTAVSWLPEEEHLLLIGMKSGAVHLVDDRKPGDSVVVAETTFDETIARIKFAPTQSPMFAMTADSSLLKVYEVVDNSSLKEMYVDNRHSDFVRGLAWNPITSELTSCGWDKTVLHHNVVNVTESS